MTATNQSASCATASCGRNINETERWASVLIGGGLVAASAARKIPFGLVGIAAGSMLVYRGLKGHCQLYQAMGISTSDPQRLGTGSSERGAGVEVSVQIERSPNEIYRYWRKLSNLPEVMSHLQEVRETDDRKSHWTASTPVGGTLEWDAEITEDQPGRLIAWRSVEGSSVDNRGRVEFRPALHGTGTELLVSLVYDPPGGRTVAYLAEWTGMGLKSQIRNDLMEFKRRLETGEIATAASHRGDSAY